VLSPRAIALQGIGFSALLLAVQGLQPTDYVPPVQPPVEEVRKTGGTLHLRKIRDAVAKAVGSEAIAASGRVLPDIPVSVDVDAFVVSTNIAASHSGKVRITDEWNVEPYVHGSAAEAPSSYVIPADSLSVDANTLGSFASVLNGIVEPALDIDVHVRSGGFAVSPDSFVRAIGVKNPTDEELIVMITSALRKR
jgi:hypothetical protein